MINIFSKSFSFTRSLGWQHAAARGMSRLLDPEIYRRPKAQKDYLTLFALQQRNELPAKKKRQKQKQIESDNSSGHFSVPGILTPIPNHLFQKSK